MRQEQQREFKVLVVEDNAGDFLLLKEVLKGSRFKCEYRSVTDGVELMEHLKAKIGVGGRLPDLIIMDLTLPRMNGHDALREIRMDERLRQIPVIVFTGSSAPDDVLKTYLSGANCYVVKPMGIDNLERTLRLIEEFWLGIVTLPSAI